MEPQITFDRALVAVQVDDVVHVMLELKAPPAPANERRPLDIVMVLDRSGSMHGAPLESVKFATQQLLRRLGTDDRLAVVAFDDEVDVVLGLAHHDADRACNVVAAIGAGGSTNLSGGWLKAFEILRTGGRSGAFKRVVLLSDGQANEGITDPDALAQLAAGANAEHVSTSTIGFGDGFDETLMASIADAGAGNDYFCGGPDQALAVFAAEFEGLASIVAQNVSVEVRPSDVVSDWGLLNEYPMVPVDGGVQVNLGDAYGDERRKVIAALQIKPQATAGPVQVGELVLRWASVIGQVALHTVTIPLIIGVTDEPLDGVPLDPAVTEEVLVLRAATARREADEELQRGDFDAAAALFEQAADDLAACPAYAGDVDELRFDVVRLREGDTDENMRKRNFAATRQSTKGRTSRFDGR